ncbi:MAG: hypothetical protein LKJ17_02070 [Oscillospiraceae bacterium]|jgi:DNA-binding ferritin-like protein (Dps family)|nr:hypothetical protein [Oscillospiraceae bacterium]
MRTKQYIKEMNQYSAALSRENQKKFDQILLTLRFAPVNNHDAEEFSHHCLDLFLQAEKENKPVEEVLNTNDMDELCNSFINESKNGYSWLEKMYWQINYLPLVLFIFTGIWEMLAGFLVKEWFTGHATAAVPVTVSLCVDTVFAMAIIAFLFRKAHSFYNIFNGADKRKDRLATLALFLGSYAVIGLFVVSQLVFTQILFYVNYAAFMGTLAAIIIVQHFIENKRV